MCMSEKNVWPDDVRDKSIHPRHGPFGLFQKKKKRETYPHIWLGLRMQDMLRFMSYPSLKCVELSFFAVNCFLLILPDLYTFACLQ